MSGFDECGMPVDLSPDSVAMLTVIVRAMSLS